MGRKLSEVFIKCPPPFNTPLGHYRWVIATEQHLSKALHDQILKRYKHEWPGGFSGINENRKWLSLEQDNAMHVVLIDEDEDFASQAAFVSRMISIGNESYFVCGINGLVTQQGHSWLASRIIRYILTNLAVSSGAHVFMGFCSEKLVKWYKRFGFLPLPGAKVRVDYRNPEESIYIDDEILIVFPLTFLGHLAIEKIQAGEELYFGSRPTW
ncbi:MAG: hypothetical protein V4525_01175 [Pseudomonadota bacterium]